MTNKPHFDSKASRPAAEHPAALQAAAPAATATENKIKVVQHHGPGFMRPQ